MTVHVITHGGCPDGHTSAWLLQKYLPATREPREFYAWSDRVNPPEDIYSGDTVIIADFSFPRDVLIELSKKAHVTLLDHHKTAEEDLKGLDKRPNLDITFDMSKSGAMLVWEYVGSPPEAYNFVSYIQDYDLWTKELPNTEEINCAIQSMPHTFEAWDELNVYMQDNSFVLVERGKAIASFRRKLINDIKRDARIMNIGGYKVPVVGCPYALGSMVAGELAEENPDVAFGAYYVDKPDARQFGLRSRSDGDDPGFDVSEVAKNFGGGGHRNAAGFSVEPGVEFPEFGPLH